MRAVQALSPIELKYELPQPTWHGHAQAFYRLRDASEFLLLDLVVIKHSNPNKFLQPEVHGSPLVHFDKCNVTQCPLLDRKAFVANLKGRLETLRVTFDLFQPLTLKELHRHNDIEALVFYQSAMLRPLVEVLRIKYQPARYNFHTRYLYFELPKVVTRKLEELFFVANREDLYRKRQTAERMFYEMLAQVASCGRFLRSDSVLLAEQPHSGHDESQT